MLTKNVLYYLEDTTENWDATLYYRLDITWASRLNFTRNWQNSNDNHSSSYEEYLNLI